MRQLTILILISFLIYSCLNNSNIKSNETSITPNKENDSITGLSNVFQKAVNVFPKDSVSLHRFYFKWFPAKDKEELNQQIRRLETLTSDESVDKYNDVNNNLKPLLTKIVNANSLDKAKVERLVTLYSEYDYLSGEALFSQLLTDSNNYELVWKSFQLMTKECNDTSYISALINLANNIRTNAELAEAMPGFIVKAIQNNPEGFLEMYNMRQGKHRVDYANYISIFDDPDIKLIEKYTDISKNSKNEDYRKLAKELLQKYKD